jgi:hypothetical protein
MSRDAGQRTAGRAVGLFPLLGCLLLAGCHSCDYCEAELRCRERELRDLREQLYWREAYNQALRQQLHAATAGPALPNCSHYPANQPPPPPIPVRDLVLGRHTGGIDQDRKPGDEALQVVLEPRDPDGKPLKAPGALYVAALVTGPDGVERPLCSWDVPPEALRPTWRYSLVGTGYHVLLPWKAWPEVPQLRVVVQFTLPDNRVLECDRMVVVHVPPELRKKPPPPPKAPAVEEAPPPRPAPPADTEARRRRAPPPDQAANPVAHAVHRQVDSGPPYLSDFVKLRPPEILHNPSLDP